MATFTFKPHSGFVETAFNKEITLPTDTLKGMLCSSSYTPNRDTHKYKSSVTNEIAGTGYVAGGQALANVAWTYDSAAKQWKLTADPLNWANSTLTGRVIVIYDDTPASNKPIVGSGVFDADVSSNSGPFTVQCTSNLWLTVQIPT